MAHSIDCPACGVTTRLSEDTYSRRILGRRVKIVCKGCRDPFFIDATGPALRASLLPPPGVRRSSAPPTGSVDVEAPRIPPAAALPSRLATAALAVPAPVAPVALAPAPPPRPHAKAPAAAHAAAPKPPRPPRRPQASASGAPSASVDDVVMSLVPESRAPALVEEELPTRPFHGRPFAAVEAPAPFYEPPPTSRTLNLPQLSTHPTPEVLAALAKPRPNRRPFAIAAALVVVFGAGMVAARPGVSDWVVKLVRPAQVTLVQTTTPRDEVTSVRAMKQAERSVPPSVTPQPAANVSLEGSGTLAQEPRSTVSSSLGALEAPAPAAQRQAPQSASAVEPAASGQLAKVDVPTTKELSAQKDVSVPGSGKLASLDKGTSSAPALPPPSADGAFDKSAAVAALQVATAQASGCRKPGDPSGMARVVVTFAPSGRVTSATISGPPFSGTQTGGCIASQFRSARVPAFEGALVTVTRSVVIQ